MFTNAPIPFTNAYNRPDAFSPALIPSYGGLEHKPFLATHPFNGNFMPFPMDAGG